MQRDYIMTIVELIGVVQCLFLAVALWYLPGNRQQANRWLSALFGVFAVVFGYMALQQNDLLHLAPLFALLRLPLLFLYGPLFYLYLYLVAQPWDTRPTSAFRRHFLPFAVAVLVYLPSVTLDRNELLDLIYHADLVRLEPNTAGLSPIQQWLWTISRYCMPVFVFHLGTYVALSLRLLLQHKRRVRQHFSRLDTVSLDWMRNLLLALIVLWVLVAVRHLLFADTAIGLLIDAGVTAMLVLFLSALGLFGLLQKNIPLPTPGPQAEKSPASATPLARYQGSAFTAEQVAHGLRELQIAMTREKPYLDSELTLTALAAQLQLPPRQLSQIINGSLGQHFVDFINGYRVEEAKRLLTDRACVRSVLTIAMEVGFNSKSAFYTAFRRHAGQTPTQYRDACPKSLVPGPQS